MDEILKATRHVVGEVGGEPASRKAKARARN